LVNITVAHSRLELLHATAFDRDRALQRIVDTHPELSTGSEGRTGAPLSTLLCFFINIIVLLYKQCRAPLSTLSCSFINIYIVVWCLACFRPHNSSSIFQKLRINLDETIELQMKCMHLFYGQYRASYCAFIDGLKNQIFRLIRYPNQSKQRK
jgi:hypothetical protein